MLRAWEAINSERELRGVLAAVADVLVPLVPVDDIGIVSVVSNLPHPYALHVAGMPPGEGENVVELIRRRQASSPHALPVRERIPVAGSEVEQRMQAWRGGQFTAAVPLIAE